MAVNTEPRKGGIKEDYTLFLSRDFHDEIMRHCKELFAQGNYFHAIFEACKAYNLSVMQKSQSAKDGAPLMLDVWGCDKGVLKISLCCSESDKDVQDGIKFLSAGLMQVIRNPTAHKPAILWPISKQDCLDILGLVSFFVQATSQGCAFQGRMMAEKMPNKRFHLTLLRFAV